MAKSTTVPLYYQIALAVSCFLISPLALGLMVLFSVIQTIRCYVRMEYAWVACHSVGTLGLTMILMLSVWLNIKIQAYYKSNNDPSPTPSHEDQPRSGAELLDLLMENGFIGMWKDRDDMTDSSGFARQLRDQPSGIRRRDQDDPSRTPPP